MPPKNLSDIFSGFREGKSVSYELLPSSSSSRAASPSPSKFHRICLLCSVRRRVRTLLILLGLIGTIALAAAVYVVNYPLPPLYARWHQAELTLPQHNPSLPAPEGSDGKFLWIANHASKCGWGNAMQELFLNAYLAYRSNRTFVFDNYTWSREASNYSLYNLKPIPSRIPLTAMIRGPIVGAQFPPDKGTPRAVVPEYFHTVCEERTVIASDESYRDLHATSASAEKLIQDLTNSLAPFRCVEFQVGLPEIFDEYLFADANRLLDIWPQFSQSPIVQDFSWSTLVELAFDNNRDFISPTSPFEPPLSSYAVSGLGRYTPIPGLLVLHVRRGDFKGHCRDVLPRRDIGFTGFNSFPTLPDPWIPYTDVPDGFKRRKYAERCFPDISSIVERVQSVRSSSSGQRLSQVYIMTNAAPSWVAKLKRALLERHPWAHVASSRDLFLTPEQKGVAQAIDMLVAQRAQVFIGNGFSTLSGMVVMLRMAHGIAPETNRHW